MARYIDADKFAARIKASPVFPNMGQDGYFIQEFVLDLIDRQVRTADVVPKSEVELLKADNEQLTINMNAYGLTAKRLAEENENLEIELENMRRNLGDAREGWNDAECEVERLRKALDEYEETSGLKQAKAEVARANAMGKAMLLDAIDTFRNLLCIESWLDYEDERKHYIVSVDDVNRIHAELKKKYTGDQT